MLLQPLNDEPPPHAKCKDKFLVQSAFISPDEEMRTLAEMVRRARRRCAMLILVVANGKDKQVRH